MFGNKTFTNHYFKFFLSFYLVLICFSANAHAADMRAGTIDIFVDSKPLRTECLITDKNDIYIPAQSSVIEKIGLWTNTSFSLSDRKDSLTATLKDGSSKTFANERKSKNTFMRNYKGERRFYVKLAEVADFSGCDSQQDLKAGLCRIIPCIDSVTANNNIISFNAPASLKNSQVTVEKSGKNHIIKLKNIRLKQSVTLPDSQFLKGANLQEFCGDTALLINNESVVSAEKIASNSPNALSFRLGLFDPIKTDIKTQVIRIAPCDIVKKSALNEVSVNSQSETLTITLKGSGPFNCNWSRMSSPDNRFIIDLPDCEVAEELNNRITEINHTLAKNVVSAQVNNEGTPFGRVVISLTSPSSCDISSEDANSVTLTFGARFQSPYSMKMAGQYTNVKTTVFMGNGQIICIDPGHGGGDSGACNRNIGLAEKDVTLDISKKLEAILKNRGYQVIMTRRTDRDVTYAGSPDREELGARVEMGNRADLFVSVHINASTNTGVNGFSTYWYKSGDQYLASEIQRSMVNKTNRMNRGTVRDKFYVISRTNVPSVLVEAGFISNNDEAKMLTDDAFRQKIAEGIADGLGIYISKYGCGRLATSKRASSSK